MVLTINPGEQTDKGFYKLEQDRSKYSNLMYVRFRTNTWNLKLAAEAVEYYTKWEVPVILTFMAYYDSLDFPKEVWQKLGYTQRKRTLNSYWAITTEAWRKVMDRFRDNKWVYSCGKIEGEEGDTHCRFCGNCLREYAATMERMKKI